VTGILISVILGLIVNECSEVSPWCARKLVRWSAYLRYRDPHRARDRAEELAALIDARPGKLLKLLTAVGFAGNAVLVSWKRALARGEASPRTLPPKADDATAATDPLPGLLAAVSVGDGRAWADLVDRFSPLMWSICRSWGLSGEDAADAYQVTWIRLLENLNRLQDPRRLPGWIAVTCRRECEKRLMARRSDHPGIDR